MHPSNDPQIKKVMKKYFVLIDGEKKFVANKSEADALLIDAFLSGIQGIDWTIYESDEPQESPKAGDWFIVCEKRVKQYIKEFNRVCWVEVSHKYITPYFDTMEAANKAFEALNLENATKGGAGIQCHDSIKGDNWVRYIVQTRTF